MFVDYSSPMKEDNQYEGWFFRRNWKTYLAYGEYRTLAAAQRGRREWLAEQGK